MTYRFLLFCEEIENFVMEIMISPHDKFLELHNLILKECSFREEGNHKFLICDENWKTKEIIYLRNDKAIGYDEDLFLMEEISLEEFIEDNTQRIAYVYDTENRRTFLLELVEQIFGEETSHACVRRRKGCPPVQFYEENELPYTTTHTSTEKNHSTTEDDLEETVADDAFLEEEIDLEGFEVSEQ
ncbi:MAG: hypothetical protein IKU79_00705 [Bacteroidaceae bacterium]|nr:hypothetical protein [Bacteroidaceae bacterium]